MLSFMEQNISYTRISELLYTAKQSPRSTERNSDHALRLITETFSAIDAMSLDEREELMKRLVGWMLVDKFDAKGRSALLGFQKYCIADCLLDDPYWKPSAQGGSKGFATVR